MQRLKSGSLKWLFSTTVLVFFGFAAFSQQKSDSINIHFPWKITASENPLHASPGFNDSSWDTIGQKITMPQFVMVPDKYGERFWLRTTFYVDSAGARDPVAIDMLFFGIAVEVYTDGELIATYGRTGENSRLANGLMIRPVVKTFKPGIHHLALHVTATDKHLPYHPELPILITLSKGVNATLNDLLPSEWSSYFMSVGLFIIFFILHIIIYYFSRENKLNLYFAIASLLYVFYFVCAYFALSGIHYGLSKFFLYFLIVLTPVNLVSTIFFLHLIFYQRLLKNLKFMMALVGLFAVLTLFTFFMEIKTLTVLIAVSVVLIIFSVYFVSESTRVVIQSIRKKKDGAYIFGVGYLFIILYLLFDSNIRVSGNSSGVKIMVIDQYIPNFKIDIDSIFYIVSWPLAFAVYLARDFGRMNQKLRTQMNQIEVLHSENIRQSEEKKRLLENQNRMLEEKVTERTSELAAQKEELEKEKHKSDELLLNILPAEVTEELKRTGRTQARNYDLVTVLFADFQDFTTIIEQMPPEELVSGIDEYFETFDRIIEKYPIEKIKTVGDAYICAAGLPQTSLDNPVIMMDAAFEMLNAIRQLKEKRTAEGKVVFNVRIGAHSGPLVAGVVGIKKFAYDIWGDTVNTAARMQQHGEPLRINVSGTTYNLIKHRFNCTHRGRIEAKNKGEVDMYFVEGRK